MPTSRDTRTRRVARTREGNVDDTQTAREGHANMHAISCRQRDSAQTMFDDTPTHATYAHDMLQRVRKARNNARITHELYARTTRRRRASHVRTACRQCDGVHVTRESLTDTTIIPNKY
jgi:hypothetical protein